ncbi:MAG TPA: FAD-dependent oxidoreductase [Bdellovibrionota bacterium]|jgi:hypothetical protein|nr:FAD-dependent oxidoreductase [Bdellovibrionota bacterium]
MAKKKKKVTRRQALKTMVAAGAGVAALGTGGLFLLRRRAGDGGPMPGAGGLEEFSPVDRTLGEVGPERFFGDDFNHAHGILWKLPNDEPDPDEEVKLCVVGGGMSGLGSAYLNRDLAPVVLEQAPRFGGNSKAQSWRGLNFSLGAAYLVLPDSGSKLEALYRELGVDRVWRAGDEETSAALTDQGFVRDLWHKMQGPAPFIRDRNRLLAHFLDVLHEKHGQIFPDIPAPGTGAKRKAIEALDKVSFADHLKSVLGGRPVPPRLARILESYCWSAFGASAKELSAAAGLNFYAAEFGGIAVCPGGNAKVAESLVERLYRDLPKGHLRPGCMVTRVRVENDGAVRVTYMLPSGRLKALRARAVVMSCPKFIASKILVDLEPKRVEEFKSLEYRAYWVGNALLDGAPPKDMYEIYLQKGPVPDFTDIGAAAHHQRVTDVCVANFAQEHPDGTVLSLYRALPYTGGRPETYTADYAAVRAGFEEQLRSEILPSIGMAKAKLLDLRVSRWGHPLPIPKVGNLASGLYDRIRAPFKERVFFVEQDNWAQAAIETALGEAMEHAPEIRRVAQRG